MTQANSDSLFQRERLSRFTRPVWTILVGTFISRCTFFMAWPFLIIFLNDRFHASATAIGLILSLSSLTASVTGLYIGYLSDKIGRKLILLIGSIVAFVAYTGIGLASEIWHFYVLMALVGLVSPMIEVTGKAVISDSLSEKKDRELGLNLRYFLLNLAGAIGPLIGLLVGKSHPQTLFIITGCCYLLYGVALYWGIEKRKQRPDDTPLPSFLQTIAIVRRDNVFVLMLIASFLLFLVYAQADSTLFQIIKMTGMEKAAELIVALVVINTATVTVFQFPLLKLLERRPVFKRTQLGMMLMLVAQTAFIGIDKQSFIGWCAVFFVFSLGETIAFPNINVQIDLLAKEELRGSYYGAMSLAQFGFVVGPLLGGFMIEYWHPNVFFMLTVVLCAVMIALCGVIEERAVTRKIY